jgi:hypothetical protein
LVEGGMGFTWIVPYSAAASFGSAWLMSLIFPNRDQERIRGLTWKTRTERARFSFWSSQEEQV